jgi:hypothetical protein
MCLAFEEKSLPLIFFGPPKLTTQIPSQKIVVLFWMFGEI